LSGLSCKSANLGALERDTGAPFFLAYAAKAECSGFFLQLLPFSFVCLFLIRGVDLYEWFRAVAYNLGMVRTLKAFLKDDTAATAIEYAIIAGGIATAIIATVYSIGPKLNSTFSSVSTQLK
jgi:pilus assembly protein Flp/PilA